MRYTAGRAAVLGAGLTLALTGCGGGTRDAADPSSPSMSEPTDPGPGPTENRRRQRSGGERITPAGVAAIVIDHLGARRVLGLGTYGHEPGTVDVMIELRGADRRDSFLVSVSSPRAGQEFAGAGSAARDCRTIRKYAPSPRRIRCRTLSDGTTVTASVDPSGFSDDNARGHVVSGMSLMPTGSVAFALYESYDASAPVSVTDLDDLLGDRRLTWRTAAAVNSAGKDLHVRRLDG